MSRLRVHSFAVSLDGFGAGPRQDLQNPLGVGGLFADLDLPALGYECARSVAGERATHVVLRKRA